MTIKLSDINFNTSTSDTPNWTTLFDLIYPKGAYYFSNNSTSPATLFGNTASQWTQITGKVLRCDSNTNTGGSDTVTLKITNFPPHDHVLRIGWGGSNGSWNTLKADAGAVNKRYCFRVWAHGSGGSAYADTPNFVYTKPAAITSATGGNLYFWQSANIFDVFVKCDRSAIKWPGKAQVQLYAGGAWQSIIYDAITGTSGDVKISSTTAVTALTAVFNSMADNSSNTTAIKGRIRYANADNSAYSDWKEFAITTHKVKTAQMYVAANGKTAAYTYTKDSSGKITKITPNFSINFRDDKGKGAYTYTKDSSGKITKITPNMVISYAK